MSAGESPYDSGVFDSMPSLLAPGPSVLGLYDPTGANYEDEPDLTLPEIDFKSPNSESLATLATVLPSLDIFAQPTGKIARKTLKNFA